MEALEAGDCVWIHTKTSDNPSEPDGHWFIVIFDLEPFDKNTIVIPINSYSEKHDSTLRLFEGDHSVITRDSYINYYMAQIVSQSSVNKWESEGLARKHRNQFGGNLFARIRSGIGKSDRTKHKINRMYWRRVSEEVSD